MSGGVLDLVGEREQSGSERHPGSGGEHRLLGADLPARIKNAAASLWPSSLGDAIEIGCGAGMMTQAILTAETVRSLIVIDSDPVSLQACRVRVGNSGPEPPVLFAALDGDLGIIHDTVTDTVIGTVALAEASDTRAFLTRVHHILKSRGRAAFVVPNRRYHQAVCLAMAEALAQRFARDGRWPDGCGPVLTLLGEIRKSILHGGDPEARSLVDARHFSRATTWRIWAARSALIRWRCFPWTPTLPAVRRSPGCARMRVRRRNSRRNSGHSPRRSGGLVLASSIGGMRPRSALCG